MVGAIVVVESRGESAEPAAQRPMQPMPNQHGSLASVELLGRSVLDRTLDRLRAAGIISVLVARIAEPVGATLAASVAVPRTPWLQATNAIIQMRQQRLDAVLIIALGAYLEFSPADLVQFQRQQSAPVVQGCDEMGKLPIWLVALDSMPEDAELKSYLNTASPVLSPLEGYVNRLEDLHDLRSLAVDGLTSRCGCKPVAVEVRPGVWMAQGAQVERGARIVAPAFIGRAAKVAEQCLITRCSNLENHSQIDYGTVIEDSSVLADTYVGIGLDLCHSVVDGGKLANLRHDVTLDISDPAILRQVHENRTRRSTGFRVANFGDGTGASSHPAIRR